jgi:hypothetical protein
VTTGAHAFVRGFDPHLGEVWTFGGSAFQQSALRPALVWERIGLRYVSGRTGGMPESEGSGLRGTLEECLISSELPYRPPSAGSP